MSEEQQQGGLEAAVAAAIASSGYDPDEGEDPDVVDILDDTEPSSTVEDSSTTADEPEGDKPQADIPDVYWGVDLSDIPMEKRADIIAHFEQQDSTIRKLQDRLTAAPEEPAPPTAPEEPEDISDEELLRAAGYDPEDYQAQSLVPMLRQQLALEDTVTALQKELQGRAIEETWNSQLDELETKYGKLPGDRVAILTEAVRQGYATPYETYFRIAAPARQEVENAVTKARREAAKRAEGASPKPRSGGVETPLPAKGTSLRDAVALSMKKASKYTGFSWRESVKGRFARVADSGDE